MNTSLIAVLKVVAANALQATAIATALMLTTVPSLPLQRRSACCRSPTAVTSLPRRPR